MSKKQLPTTLLFDLSKPGVYAFVNKRDSKVYISHSTNILNSVSRILNELNLGIHSNKDFQKDASLLELVVLHYNNIKADRLHYCKNYIDSYKKKGYKFYNKTTLLPKYKLDYFITADYECWICLTSKRYKKWPVMQVESVEEAKEFIRKNRVEDIMTQSQLASIV
jgi:hypothetical protein